VTAHEGALEFKVTTATPPSATLYYEIAY